MAAFHFIGFAPPETAVAPRILPSFFRLIHGSLPKPDMSDVCHNWQLGIWLGIMPRSVVIMPQTHKNDE